MVDSKVMGMAQGEIKLDEDRVAAYCTAGRALFTVRSRKTGARFTYRIQAGRDPESPLFVQVLTSADNVGGYTYLGTIHGGAYHHGKKSKIHLEAPSARAFAWFWTCLQAGRLSSMEVYHHGRCGRCGRVLTVPESIKIGLGPECAHK